MNKTEFDGFVLSFYVVLDVRASTSIKKIGIQSVFQKPAPIFGDYLIEIVLRRKCPSLDEIDRF